MTRHESDRITTREFWTAYWLSKKGSILQKVGPDFLFSDIIRKYLPLSSGLSFIEIGGFPGYFSVYFMKYFGYRVSLLDYFIDEDIVSDLVNYNEIQQKIDIIELDIFSESINRKFDVVFSSGFIEHFNDSESVIQIHFDYVSPGGYAFIALPNFRGLNGLVQRFFDPENLTAHNLDVMSPQYLGRICISKGFELIWSGYYGNFGVWLEKEKERSYFLRKSFKLINRFGKRLFRSRETRLFSPYIILIARRPLGQL